MEGKRMNGLEEVPGCTANRIYAFLEVDVLTRARMISCLSFDGGRGALCFAGAVGEAVRQQGMSGVIAKPSGGGRRREIM